MSDEQTYPKHWNDQPDMLLKCRILISVSCDAIRYEVREDNSSDDYYGDRFYFLTVGTLFGSQTLRVAAFQMHAVTETLLAGKQIDPRWDGIQLMPNHEPEAQPA